MATDRKRKPAARDAIACVLVKCSLDIYTAGVVTLLFVLHRCA